MTINDQVRNKKLRYNINREPAKILALSSGKIHKYEYLTGEDILPYNQQQMIEQAKLTYSPLSFWKRYKNNWRSRRKINKSNLRSRIYLWWRYSIDLKTKWNI